jgi:hypothetical protein
MPRPTPEPVQVIKQRRDAALEGMIAAVPRTKATLRGLGATVVDAPPGRLASQLADAYLKVKATGRL